MEGEEIIDNASGDETNGPKNQSLSAETPKKQSKTSRDLEPPKSRKQSESPRVSESKSKKQSTASRVSEPQRISEPPRLSESQRISKPPRLSESQRISEPPRLSESQRIPEPPTISEDANKPIEQSETLAVLTTAQPEKQSDSSRVSVSPKPKQPAELSTVEEKVPDDALPSEKVAVTTRSTRDMLITTPLEDCENPHRVKVSVVGAGRVGMACALSILMKRIASEVCLIDKDSSMAEAEAEDIRQAGIFLGNPLVTGTSDITMVRDSAVVIIAIGEQIPGETPNVRHTLDIFKKVIPPIAKLACNAVLLIVTQPIDVMSYVAWKISKFPSNRVIGTGTLLDTMRFQHYLGKRLGLANSSISCACIGSQGGHSVPVWSSVHVGGVKLHDINPRIGSEDDPEKWQEIADSIHGCEEKLDLMKGEKGPSCWALGVCTAEIVDAIVRNTRIILPASTYIHSCSHGTDKDVYMSVPCVLGREGVHHKVRQRLTDQEKSSLQACADSIRNALRDSGILRDTKEDLQD